MAVSMAGAGEPRDRASLARSIRRAVAELQSLQRQQEAERAAHERSMRAVDRQIERIALDVESLRGKVGELQRELAKRRSQVEDDRAAAARAKGRRRAVAERAAGLVESMRRRAEVGVPGVRGLVERMGEAADSLRAERGPGTGAESVSGVHELIGDYLRGHRERSIGNRRVELSEPGVARFAYVVRLGSVAALYLTEDGGVAGAAARQRDQRWRAPLGEARHERVRSVVAVLREQRAPRMVDVPLVIRDAGEGQP